MAMPHPPTRPPLLERLQPLDYSSLSPRFRATAFGRFVVGIAVGGVSGFLLWILAFVIADWLHWSKPFEVLLWGVVAGGLTTPGMLVIRRWFWGGALLAGSAVAGFFSFYTLVAAGMRC